jgi:hypothetical protein
MGMHVQARHDKLGKRVIQTIVYMARYISQALRINRRVFKRMFQLNDGFKRALHSHVANETLLQ